MDKEELKKEYGRHSKEIRRRIKEFRKVTPKNQFSELMFCLLTPQSKAEKCWQAVEYLRNCKLDKNNVENCLKTKTRFYRNKTKYLLEADKKRDKIKKIINNLLPSEIRFDLVEEIKGLGMKEASHFLRNIGKSNNELAILDRHVLRKLQELKVIDKIPNLNNKNYLLIENKMKDFADDIGIDLDDLDLLFWKIESGRIFK